MDRRETLFLELFKHVQGLQKGLLQRSTASISPIPFGQKAALFGIALHKTLNCKQLALLLHVTPGAATQHIEALVQAGLVLRDPDPQTRRSVIVRLSDKGEQLIKKLERDRLARMQDLCTDIDDRELETFVHVMQKMNHKLQEGSKG